MAFTGEQTWKNAQPSQKEKEEKTGFRPPPQTELKSQSSLQTIKSDVTMETADRRGWGCTERLWDLKGILCKKEVWMKEREEESRWTGWRRRKTRMCPHSTDVCLVNEKTTCLRHIYVCLSVAGTETCLSVPIITQTIAAFC